MPITLLDVLLLVVMLISGMLAMIRGFMREILSIASWLIAAAAAYYAFPTVMPRVQQYIANDTAAKGVAIAGVFLITLLVVAIITVRISDMILDSRVGALDRTLGFLFGLARGLVIVAVAFAFFDWLVVEKSQPDWVRNGKSVVILKGARDWVQERLPENLEATISSKVRRAKPEEPDDSGSAQRSEAPAPAR